MKIKILTIMAVSVLSSNIVLSAETYPGSNCQPTSGSQSSHFETGYKSIKNMSKEYLLVTCPMPTTTGVWDTVQFSIKTTPSGTVAKSLVYNPPKKFSCYVVNLGRKAVVHSIGSSTPFSTGSVVSSFIRTNYKSYTHYQNLYCSIPPNSELNWYEKTISID